MFLPSPALDVTSALLESTEPNYVMLFTTCNLLIGGFIAFREARKARQSAVDEKPGRRPE